MKVTALVTETKQIEKEIDINLPYCAKDGSTYYRINSDQSILKLCNYNTWLIIQLTTKEDSDHKKAITKVLSFQQCDESEVLEMAETINESFAKRSTELIAV